MGFIPAKTRNRDEPFSTGARDRFAPQENGKGKGTKAVAMAAAWLNTVRAIRTGDAEKTHYTDTELHPGVFTYLKRIPGWQSLVPGNTDCPAGPIISGKDLQEKRVKQVCNPHHHPACWFLLFDPATGKMSQWQ